MNVLSWEGPGWHVQLRNDGDRDEGGDEVLVVRIATGPDVDGEDAVWMPIAVWDALHEETDGARAREIIPTPEIEMKREESQ